MDNIIRAQLDSARHPDLLAQSIMSEATAKKASMTLRVTVSKGVPYI
jgi:hypothetical protein